MNTTSVSLLQQLARGTDQTAWNKFVQLYTPMLIAWCKRAGLRDADAADLLQQLFLTLHQQLPTFEYDRSGSFRAWLKTILLNSVRNLARKRKTEASVHAVLAELETAEDTDPRLQLEQAEFQSQLVKRALQLMQASYEPTTWKACWEFVVNGRAASEVAAELGISSNAVYLAKSRILRHLRSELEWMLEQ